MIRQEKALRITEPPAGTILKDSRKISQFSSGHESSERVLQNRTNVHWYGSILELENKLLTKLQDLENFIIEHFYLLRYHFNDMKLRNYY